MKKPNIHVANIIKEYGLTPDSKDIADYCYIHYKSITGLATDGRNKEGEFPDEIAIIFEWFESHFGYDFMVINNYWGNLIG